ncbi:MAG TPA: efflux RND transporter periplasmic adaptor subunit [Methylomirabilota bacterium]|jgi:HlyD family secretion protein|nr:efflux RND transporter periplasmic adaptor subunit [Methylomirabilota bacterium]
MDQRKLRNRILLFLLVAGIVAYALVRLSGREPVAKIAAVTPIRDNLVSSISSNGKVEPIAPFVMRAPLDTFVEKVTGVEGQQVKRGQLLLELNVRDARAQLDDAEAKLLRAQDELHIARSGGKVEESARVAADLAKAQGDRDRLLRNHDALERLIAKQAATREELAANDLALSNAQAEVKRLSAAKQEFEHGVILDAGRTALQVQQIQSEIASLRAKVASARITAPTDGTLYSLPVKTGEYVKTGDLLAEMADLHRVRVRAFIDEPELGALAPNEPVKITWDALPNRVWTGRTEIIPKQVVARNTRSVGELLCAVDNQKLELLPNINVDVKIHSNERMNVLTVPRAAVDAESDHRYVFVVTQSALGKSRLARREVQLGIADSTNFEVISGLQENEMVALPGDAVLHDGMAVRIVNTDSAYVRGHSDAR